MDKTTKQIRDAFVDGYISGTGVLNPDGYRSDDGRTLRQHALQAWRDEVTTNKPSS